MTELAEPPKKRRSHPLLLAAGFVTLLVTLFLIMPQRARSERTATVDRLLQAAKAGDHEAFNALVSPDAEFWTLSDVIMPLDATTTREMIGNCRELRKFEGLDTVAVQFDCARDAHDRYFLEFTFCGDKVNQASFPEWGRMFPSPIGRDLMERALGLFQDDMGPCAKGLSSRIPESLPR